MLVKRAGLDDLVFLALADSTGDALGWGGVCSSAPRDWALETGAKGLTLATAVTDRDTQSLYESCGWRRDDEFQHYSLLV